MNDEAIPNKAVALRYDRDKESAPRVVASGQGLVAARIMEIARASGVPVTQDAGLLALLAQVPLGTEIPVDLYQAVAEVLAFVYRLNQASVNGVRERPEVG